jgi:hypothetical protein
MASEVIDLLQLSESDSSLYRYHRSIYQDYAFGAFVEQE